MVLTLPALRDSVPLVRAFVNGWAELLGVPAAAVEPIGLCTSEAVTNVVFHAYREAGAPGDVRVTVEHRGSDALYVTVADDGLGMTPRVDSPGLGMGLPLIAHFAHDVEIRARRPQGVELEMRFDAHALRQAA